LSPPLPSSLAAIKLANPGSPGKMAVRMERERGSSLSPPVSAKTNFPHYCWYTFQSTFDECASLIVPKLASGSMTAYKQFHYDMIDRVYNLLM